MLELISTLAIGDVVAIVTLLLTVVGGTVVGTTKAINWNRKRRLSKLVVKQIKGRKDRDFETFVDLYERTIESSVRILPTEILSAIEAKKNSFGIYYKLIVCKRGDSMLGFAQLMHQAKGPLAFISYFGVDPDSVEARSSASVTMIRFLARYLRTKCPLAEGVLFEVESPSEVDLLRPELDRRRARIRRFKELSRRAGMAAFELDFRYLSPEFPTEEGKANEKPMTLMFVPVRKLAAYGSVRKEELLKLIGIVYNEIYLPVYARDAEIANIYRADIERLLSKYDRELPAGVRLIG